MKWSDNNDINDILSRDIFLSQKWNYPAVVLLTYYRWKVVLDRIVLAGRTKSILSVRMSSLEVF